MKLSLVLYPLNLKKQKLNLGKKEKVCTERWGNWTYESASKTLKKTSGVVTHIESQPKQKK